jgi:hypothetical protein
MRFSCLLRADLLLLVAISGISVTSAKAADDLKISWTNNMLSITSTNLPGGKVDVWYLEAFCRSGSTGRDWKETTIPHRTELVEASRDGRHIQLRTKVEPSVEVQHDIHVLPGAVEFHLNLKNNGDQPVDVQWFQPCMRVDKFTGKAKSNYIDRSFIFTEAGLTTLDKTRRTEEARYRGGQVYVPKGVPRADVNPRPISPDIPVNGLIGSFSADGKSLLAMAWDQTQELFQGVIVCLHNDPRVGGLAPGETKKLHGKVYVMENNPEALLARYKRDFGGKF